jgi:hypothetical protein
VEPVASSLRKLGAQDSAALSGRGPRFPTTNDAGAWGFSAEPVEYGAAGAVLAPIDAWSQAGFCDDSGDVDHVLLFDLGVWGYDVTRLNVFGSGWTDFYVWAYGPMNGWRIVYPGAVNSRNFYMCIGGRSVSLQNARDTIRLSQP